MQIEIYDVNYNDYVSSMGTARVAHVEGIKELLDNPVVIRENLQKLGLTFMPPPLIRRISANVD